MLKEAKGESIFLEPRERRCEFRVLRDNKTLFSVYQEIDESMLNNAVDQNTDV